MQTFTISLDYIPAMNVNKHFLSTAHRAKEIFSLRGTFLIFSFSVRSSTLLHLPPLRFHCVGGCWDRTQDGVATKALAVRRSIHSDRSHISHPKKYWNWKLIQSPKLFPAWHTAESIWCIIEDQASSPSYDLDPSPSPVSKMSLLLSLTVCRPSSLLMIGEREGGGRSQIIWRRESLVLYNPLRRKRGILRTGEGEGRSQIIWRRESLFLCNPLITLCGTLYTQYLTRQILLDGPENVYMYI